MIWFIICRSWIPLRRAKLLHRAWQMEISALQRDTLVHEIDPLGRWRQELERGGGHFLPFIPISKESSFPSWPWYRKAYCPGLHMMCWYDGIFVGKPMQPETFGQEGNRLFCQLCSIKIIDIVRLFNVTSVSKENGFVGMMVNCRLAHATNNVGTKFKSHFCKWCSIKITYTPLGTRYHVCLPWDNVVGWSCCLFVGFACF